jgi:hypothetical protein
MKLKATYYEEEFRGWIPETEYILLVTFDEENFPGHIKVEVEHTSLFWIFSYWTAMFHFFKNITRLYNES